MSYRTIRDFLSADCLQINLTELHTWMVEQGASASTTPSAWLARPNIVAMLNGDTPTIEGGNVYVAPVYAFAYAVELHPAFARALFVDALALGRRLNPRPNGDYEDEYDAEWTAYKILSELPGARKEGTIDDWSPRDIPGIRYGVLASAGAPPALFPAESVGERVVAQK